jgi:putative hydrolase of the HAD superfamily
MAEDMRSVTTLTFDVVGTVIDFEQGICEWWIPRLGGTRIGGTRGGAGRGRPDDSARAGDAAQAPDGRNAPAAEEILSAFAEAEDRLQNMHPEMPFTQMLPRIYEELSERWGLKRSEEAAASFQRSIEEWPPFEDSVEALRLLGHSYRLVAVTNADRWATEAMNRTIGEQFHELVSCDEVGVNKPDRRVFAYALEKLGASREEVLHVAQSQYHDIGGARSFGLKTAWVERRAGTGSTGATPQSRDVVEPDIHVHSLAELAEVLRR